ncbi:MAG: SIS domain-containing protein [Candidatus Bathyarchaeota archaeon]|nr:SIS domain-containing protein [Candidatus Bathyarchaeota archaeon]
MKATISTIGFANKIRDNILAINKSSLELFYEELKAAECIICSGSGRSLYSLNAAMSLLTRGKTDTRQKVVLTPDDPGFPGKNMYDAAMDLEKRFKKTLLLMNSGSGSSNDPLVMAQDLSMYIDEKGTDRFSMGLLTSNLESPLAQVTKRYGNVVQIEGRGKSKPSAVYSETGIMGDIFELGTLELLNMMIEAFFRGFDVDGIFKLCEEEFEIIGNLIDANVESETYTRLVDMLERGTNVFLGGKGTANQVAQMTGIRLFHIKSFLGDNVFMARGVNTPRPRAGDVEILISYTGETKPVLLWCDALKKFNGSVLAITACDNSPLAKKSDLKIVLPEEPRVGIPRRFYTRAAYVLSPLPVKLAERLTQRGLDLPEYILSWYHSITE